MSNYETLVNVLDRLRKEAPPQHRRYHVLDTDIEGLNQARSRAFIHLFLKVKFGLLDFVARERVVTDGANDGGIDAYHIDPDLKRVCFIQSKFRTKEDNFREKEIELEELLAMDVDRITEGQLTDESGTEYNGKIKQLIRELSAIPDIGRYQYEVVILANVGDLNPTKLKKLTGGFEATVFNHEKTYDELLFPVVTGTYYNPHDLIVLINLSNTSASSPRISYHVTTGYKDCDINVLFVPTLEIAKAMYKYRNSILRYNPRSYLELAHNPVNSDIASSITDLRTNEFSIFNNGITMLSYGTAFNERIGQRDRAQLIVTRPQIINGGQTAYTLARIYEEQLGNAGQLEELFSDKEVLLKVITLNEEKAGEDGDHLAFIEAISKATNQQTPVDEADRRSNDSIQIELQRSIFDRYGYFYERKRGEYADGIREGYIRRPQLIDRELFLRLCLCCDMNPAPARRSSRRQLFKEDVFNRTLNDPSRYHEYFFAFKCYETLNRIERSFSSEAQNKYGVANYGNALRYGKFAAVAACRLKYAGPDSLAAVEQIVAGVLGKWLEFESHIWDLVANRQYFRSYVDPDTEVVIRELNYDNYYKGRTVNADLVRFFGESQS